MKIETFEKLELTIPSLITVSSKREEDLLNTAKAISVAAMTAILDKFKYDGWDGVDSFRVVEYIFAGIAKALEIKVKEVEAKNVGEADNKKKENENADK